MTERELASDASSAAEWHPSAKKSPELLPLDPVSAAIQERFHMSAAQANSSDGYIIMETTVPDFPIFQTVVQTLYSGFTGEIEAKRELYEQKPDSTSVYERISLVSYDGYGKNAFPVTISTELYPKDPPLLQVAYGGAVTSFEYGNPHSLDPDKEWFVKRALEIFGF